MFLEKILKRTFGLGEPDAARIAEGLANHRRFTGVLNGHLAARTYLVGDALTLADFTLATSLMPGRTREQRDAPVSGTISGSTGCDGRHFAR